MKKVYLISTLIALILSFQLYSQKTNEIGIYYGFADSEFLRNEHVVGAGGTDNQNSFNIGIKYLRKISNKLCIETGFNYMKTSVTLTNSSSYPAPIPRIEDYNLFSIPIYANYTFKKYFFLNGGPIIDFQDKKETLDSQIGLGYSIGFGWKYVFNDIIFFINPNFKRHSVVPFDKEKYHLRLTEFGIQLGAGYTF